MGSKKVFLLDEKSLTLYRWDIYLIMVHWQNVIFKASWRGKCLFKLDNYHLKFLCQMDFECNFQKTKYEYFFTFIMFHDYCWHKIISASKLSPFCHFETILFSLCDLSRAKELLHSDSHTVSGSVTVWVSFFMEF